MSLSHHGHSNAGDHIRNAERTPRSVRVANRDSDVTPRSRTLNGGLDPAEMGRRSGEARREKKAEREQRAQDNALTFRQRLGVSLSKLSQPELDQVVSALAQRGNANALARLADQAFGKPLPAEEDVPGDEGLASLTREERAVLRQMLEAGLEPDEPDPRLAEEQSANARARRKMPTE
jgi:hypothetical protein